MSVHKFILWHEKIHEMILDQQYVPNGMVNIFTLGCPKLP